MHVNEAVSTDQRVNGVVGIVVTAGAEGELKPAGTLQIAAQSTGVLHMRNPRPARRAGNRFARKITARRDPGPLGAAGRAVERSISSLVIGNRGIHLQSAEHGPA